MNTQKNGFFKKEPFFCVKKFVSLFIFVKFAADIINYLLNFKTNEENYFFFRNDGDGIDPRYFVQ